MYTALYRRYRPATFDEMVGQEHIVRILKNQIESGNVSHAYLFCGTRGTGKTSAARIFAKGVNCLSGKGKPCGVCENCLSIQNGIFFDVIEIDAASNNKVENIRELRESVKYPPAAGLCKVYIIDEVHMLSTSAFNALLKTLEEPPEHVIFVLATTEPHKLPPTILSRCLRLDFRRVPEAKIRARLGEICRDCGVEYEESALALIAANGDGSVRDSLSILEQCIPAGDGSLTRADVVSVLGTAGEEVFLEITDLLAEGDTAGVFLLIDRLAADGKDMKQFLKDWTFHFRNLMMSGFADRLEEIIDMSCENAEKVKAQRERLTQGFISAAIRELSEAQNRARFSSQARTILELSVLKLSEPEVSEDCDSLIQRISDLEARLDGGAFVKTVRETKKPEISEEIIKPQPEEKSQVEKETKKPEKTAAVEEKIEAGAGNPAKDEIIPEAPVKEEEKITPEPEKEAEKKTEPAEEKKESAGGLDEKLQLDIASLFGAGKVNILD